MITLFDPELGTLALRRDPFVVTGFQIGSRAPRVVKRDRALADGEVDDTRFGGGRAVTIALTLNDKLCGDPTPMQELFDQLLPYMALRRRPVLTWSLPGSGGVVRQLTVRGDNAPMQIGSAKHPTITCSFVAADGEITSAGDPICTVIQPAADVELGRTYNLAFNRAYPTSSAIGDRLIVNPGNELSHWTAAIFGDNTNPSILVNGVRIDFNNNGGLVLPAGNSVVIDTKAKTMLFNGDPVSPRYDRTNFTEWAWADVMLRPGNNTIRFAAALLGTGASMNFCYRPAWA